MFFYIKGKTLENLISLLLCCNQNSFIIIIMVRPKISEFGWFILKKDLPPLLRIFWKHELPAILWNKFEMHEWETDGGYRLTLHKQLLIVLTCSVPRSFTGYWMYARHIIMSWHCKVNMWMIWSQSGSKLPSVPLSDVNSWSMYTTIFPRSYWNKVNIFRYKNLLSLPPL